MQYTLKQIIHKFKILGAIWSRMQLALLTILRVFFFKTFGPTGVFAIYTVKKKGDTQTEPTKEPKESLKLTQTHK